MKLKNLLKARDIISDIEDIVQDRINLYEEESVEHETLWQIWWQIFKLYNLTQQNINDLLIEENKKRGGEWIKWIENYIM